MTDFYSAISGEICGIMRDICPDKAFSPDMECRFAEASLPLGYHPCPEGNWTSAINKRLAPQLCIGRVSERNRHMLFFIKPEAYSAHMEHIIKSCPSPAMPALTDDTVDYAIARMLMLSRYDGGALPEAARRALWPAFGICVHAGAKQAALRRRAAEASIAMLEGCPAHMRQELGMAGKCLARLLSE